MRGKTFKQLTIGEGFCSDCLAPVTAREASKIIKRLCVDSEIPHSKVSAKSVSFSDLARGERVFVTVFGWQRSYESPSWCALLVETAKKNGFSVDVREVSQ